MNISARIKALREKTGKNQEEFATSIGLKRANYAQIEGGNQKPTIETLSEIVRIYNKEYPEVTYEWLIDGKKMAKPPPKEAATEGNIAEPSSKYSTKTESQEIAWRDKYISVLEKKIQQNTNSYVLQENFEDVSAKVEAIQEFVTERLGQLPGTSYEEVSAQLHIKKDEVKKWRKTGIRGNTNTSHKQ